MPTLVEQIIRDRLAVENPLRFAEFMNLALYHPEHGYYLQDRPRTGKAGDFFTNVSVGAIYGQVLGDEFAAMFTRMGSPPAFRVVEQGSEDGQLACDVLTYLQRQFPEVYAATTYLVVEPHPTKRILQAGKLEAFGPKVTWAESWARLPAFVGVVHAHELLDAFPTHVVEHDGDRWRELGVTFAKGAFTWAAMPAVTPELAPHLDRLPLPVHLPYRTEINLNALSWVREVATRLLAGYLLVVDYGYPRAVYYAPHRHEGTLACYHRHRREDNPFNRVGEQDITAHVDFTTVAEAGEQAGLSIRGFTDQHHFMVGASERRLREWEKDATGKGVTPAGSAVRGLQTLLHPAQLGMAFHYLLLSRPALPVTPGFRYARDARRELGLNLPPP
ncbi:MAG TPA: SAM-dependent methyltransferase [Chthoniobacterales bacterium]